jgi:hypothetical protein
LVEPEVVKALFCELPIGTSFERHGRFYRKIAKSMAIDEKEWGTVFMNESEVQVTDDTPLFQGPRQPEPYWADHLTPAPGQWTHETL